MRLRTLVQFVALVVGGLALMMSLAMPAFADRAADIAKCNAITDVQRRTSCLALIAPPGGGSQGQPPAAAVGVPITFGAAPQGRDACKFNGDFIAFQACLDRADAGLPLVETPAHRGPLNDLPSYYAALNRCDSLRGRPELHRLCYHIIGKPQPSVQVAESTYDDLCRLAILSCIANQ